MKILERAIKLNLLLFLITFTVIYPQSDFTDKNDILNFASPTIKIYTNKDGLPQSSILSMATDKLGLFWIGTQDGAAFNDGNSWNIVNMPNRSLSNSIPIIYISSDSSIWFGTRGGGLHRYKSNKWQSFYKNDSLPSNDILSILEQKVGDDNYLWIGTNSGLFKYELKNGKLVFWEKSLDNHYVSDICRISENIIWFATNKGIYSFNGSNYDLIKVPNLSANQNVLRINKSKDGAVWIGGIGFLGKYHNNSWNMIKIRSNALVYSIFEDRYNQIWVGTNDGIMKVYQKNYQTDYQLQLVNLFNTTQNNRYLVWCISETIDGSLWIGSYLGLFRFNERRWLNITERMKFEDGGATSIVQTKNGDYWFGTENGILQFSNGRWKSYDKVTKGAIIYIYQSADSSLWMSVFNQGVLRYKNGYWKRFTMKDGLPSHLIWSIYQTKDGKIWFGCEGGLAVYHSGTWKTFTQKDVLVDNNFLCLYQTNDSILWIGTTKGILKYYKGKFELFKTKKGSFDLGVLNFYEMNDSKRNNQNILWFGSISNGIFQLNMKTNELKNFSDTSSIRISNNSINSITEDKQGRLYLLTNKGITRFYLKDNNVIKSEMFYSEDGLPNDEGIHGSTAMMDSKGRVWFGTTEGAAILDPQKEIQDRSKKPLLIQEISISNFKGSDVVYNNITLNYNQNNLIFEYSLISLFKNSNSTYKIQLDGYDKEPSEWINDNKKEYTNLYEGKYNFQVWGKDYAGNITGPVEFHFTINPPFWRSWWFYSIIVFLFIIISFVSIRVYISKKVKKKLAIMERKIMIENERLRISKDMHDSVGSSLTRISILSNRVSNELENITPIPDSFDEIKERIFSINDISRESIDSMNEVIWSINPKFDNLRSLVSFIRNYFNNIFGETTINHSMNVEGEILELKLLPDVRRDIFLIFKETLNNIIKHSNASIVKINIIFEKNVLSIEISDNGEGFDESSLKKEKTSNSLGLSNMRERAKSINAALNILSIPGKGTTINFSINL